MEELVQMFQLTPLSPNLIYLSNSRATSLLHFIIGNRRKRDFPPGCVVRFASRSDSAHRSSPRLRRFRSPSRRCSAAAGAGTPTGFRTGTGRGDNPRWRHRALRHSGLGKDT